MPPLGSRVQSHCKEAKPELQASPSSHGEHAVLAGVAESYCVAIFKETALSQFGVVEGQKKGKKKYFYP